MKVTKWFSSCHYEQYL